jgi:hypothetical protein
MKTTILDISLAGERNLELVNGDLFVIWQSTHIPEEFNHAQAHQEECR